MNHMDEQTKALRKDQAKVQRHIDLLSSDMEGARRANDTAVRRLNEHEEKIRLVRDDIGRQNQRVDLLKEIREVKLHSDTVKKLHRRSYNAELILEQQGLVSTLHADVISLNCI
jgi:EAL domain-containing protein (putative c-di-GMP-specific phosphodiesterase class I)